MLGENDPPAGPGAACPSFVEFVRGLAGGSSPEPSWDALRSLGPEELYGRIAGTLGLPAGRIAQLAAAVLRLDYAPLILPQRVEVGILPPAFSRSNRVVSMLEADGSRTFILSNPFNAELLTILNRYVVKGTSLRLCVTDPENIDALFQPLAGAGPLTRTSAEDAGQIVFLADRLLRIAAEEGASDLHIEPKESEAVVRLRVDGGLRRLAALPKELSRRLISRFKALAEMDTTEHRRPADGAVKLDIDGKPVVVRLATTCTPYGQSLTLRLLKPWPKARGLTDLGMTECQAERIVWLAGQRSGMILIAGQVGSGKTTTTYALLSQLDCVSNSVITVEDPIEYRIEGANQQQVNEAAGVTFESLLKSSVRQDPDVLFMGEVRDPQSAKMAVDFASTGHMTLCTLHTSSATSAILRLDRLGLSRATMADSISCIVGQRLIKKLCPHCRRLSPSSPQEWEALRRLGGEQPVEVAHPVGCPRCRGTGYLGREGVFEILHFSPETSAWVRSGVPGADIRRRLLGRGEFLMPRHGLEKVRALTCAPEDVPEIYAAQPAEGEERWAAETLSGGAAGNAAEPFRLDENTALPERESILVVDDDPEARTFLQRVLERSGYELAMAADAAQALDIASRNSFSLILSDVMMPGLDGFQFLEMARRRRIEAPILFLSAKTDAADENRGLELGAVDYIRKPFNKETLLRRVQNALRGR